MRIMVYSHDTFGLGNIRRMLAICSHLRRSISDLSILIVSGSPMLHSFRVMQGIDYIKLPCLKRSQDGDLGVRFLDLKLDEIVRLRRELILATVVSFQPDIVLVDKKPAGLAGELEPSLRYIKCNLPQARILLVLRDILDSPESTIAAWGERGDYNTLQWYFDDILVLGVPEIFDVCAEYAFPSVLCDKVRYCGYVARHAPLRPKAGIRGELGAREDEKLVLVTTGGGEDGYQLLSAYVGAAELITKQFKIRSLVVAGPELAPEQTRAIREAAQRTPGIRILEFTNDMLSYMNAADVVVSMGGYNTICELLTLQKKAVVVPRVRPVEEQKIRAERMANLNVFKTILPDDLTPHRLQEAIAGQLAAPEENNELMGRVDLGALPRISEILMETGLSPLSGNAGLEAELMADWVLQGE